ncbi:LBF_2804 family protein [Methyloprofundus sp.]|uniref:LBF_2804 family protein n=1 Tax=Methyloprofundus sp. TaxID=2020875 RepID=UPI003D133B35
MPEKNNKKSPSYAREETPGFLEKIGVKYYRYLANKSGTADMQNISIDDLPPDITLRTLASNITGFAAIIAFAIGALTTFVSIWVEWTYMDTMQPTAYYLLYGSTLVIMLAIEMVVLFWLGLKTVYSLACLTGHNQTAKGSCLPGDDAVPNILARAALEVPDPIIHYLGIDPLKHLSKSKLFLVAFLYKAKVVLSGLAVKFLLIRLFGKGEARTAFSWVAIPITGIWDAFTLYKVAREARLRLFGNKLAEHIVNDMLTDDLIAQLSPKAREGSVRAVATMMVLAQNYHPNMLVLLLRLCDTFQIDDSKEYDDWEDFLVVLDEVTTKERYFLLDLLSVAAAFDGHLSQLERHHLPEAFKELTKEYMERTEQLMNLLLNGQLHAAKKLCVLDFDPG